MNEEIYLMYLPEGWGVFGKTTCPDPHGVIPDYFYRKYEFPSERFKEIFRKLLNIREKLVEENIIPTKENHNQIFPKLEELLTQ